MTHLGAFQAIATANDGNRQAGTSGHEESVDYVEGLLDAAGYTTWRQPFDYERTDFTGSSLARVSPSAVNYSLGIDYVPMDYSGRWVRERTRHGGRHQPRGRPGIDERLRVERLRRVPHREHRPHPARHVPLRGQGRQRDPGRGERGHRLQPGQRRAGRRPALALRRHPRPAGAQHPRRQHVLRPGRGVGLRRRGSRRTSSCRSPSSRSTPRTCWPTPRRVAPTAPSSSGATSTPSVKARGSTTTAGAPRHTQTAALTAPSDMDLDIG